MISDVISQVAESIGVTSSSKSKSTKSTDSEYGKTIGTPELSDTAKEYYSQLKEKYSNVDFILVSRDMKEQAQANSAQYANPTKMVVLIDEDKIERMATDENYRKQYESIISGATSQLSQLQQSLGSNSNVKGFGMQVNDGGVATYFAVLEKSNETQKALQEKRAQKKAEQKAQEKKEAKKEEQEERIENQRTKRKEESERLGDSDENYVVITANSIEELLQKINDSMYADMSDSVQTDEEKKIGQQFDVVC